MATSKKTDKPSRQADFNTSAHGKWILAGEHAVIRGGHALVFPVPSKYLAVQFWQTDTPLHIEFDAPFGETLLLMFWGILDAALEKLNQTRQSLTGLFVVTNNIPMGAGMGFSAALCVCLARWFVWQGWLAEKELFHFARELEDHFHGKSSGVDIAGAIHQQGVYFNNIDNFHALTLAWQPALYLSFSNRYSVTAKCTQIVSTLWSSQPALAETIDQTMQTSVADAYRALTTLTSDSFNILSYAITQAHQCFERWGLIEGELKTHLAALEAAGAHAVKPTGAGDGGYVLSLWESAPPTDLPYPLIPVMLQ